MSVVSFALAVVFIIRLFSTSAFRVPKFESRKAIYVLQIVLGANKNKLSKRNRKDSGKQKCVSERTLA